MRPNDYINGSQQPDGTWIYHVYIEGILGRVADFTSENQLTNDELNARLYYHQAMAEAKGLI